MDFSEFIPVTAKEVSEDMERRKHRPDALTRKPKKVKQSGRNPFTELVSASIPLTDEEVAEGIESRKHKTYGDVPLDEQKRIGDIIRAYSHELLVEKAALAFGLVPPPEPKRRGRPYLGKQPRARCATPGCPFKAKGEHVLCLRCRRHIDKGNLPK